MTQTPTLVISADPAAMAKSAATHIAEAISEVVSQGRRCSLCLAGGGTPRATYSVLAAMEGIPWAQVDFYYGDERCVAPDDADSNHRMARESLLGPLNIAESQIFRMPADDEDREAAAAQYAASLPASLDVLLLGMGGDGHTASLFPGHEAMSERERAVVPVKGPKPPPWRLTITAPVVEAAARVFVLAHGAGKAPKVAQALQGTRDIVAVPIQLAASGNGTWFLDTASAAQLKDL